MGTNSTRLLVADVDGADLAEVERLLRITRLGDRVDADGRLSDAGMERVHTVLEGYAARARELGAERVLATATSAVRDADNGSEFLADVRRQHGFETRLLSGREEAEPTYRGVTSRRAAGGDARLRHRRRLDGARARRAGRRARRDQPRRRLRADVGTLASARPADRGGARRAARGGGRAPARGDHEPPRWSASPAPSRRSRPSTSASTARSPRKSTATCSGRHCRSAAWATGRGPARRAPRGARPHARARADDRRRRGHRRRGAAGNGRGPELVSERDILHGAALAAAG